MADAVDITVPASVGPAGAAKPAGQTPEQLRTLAAQFESLLLGQMLKEMRQSMFDEDEDKDSAMGSGPMADTVFSELSVALGKAGGMGLGNSLLGPLMAQAGIKSDATSTVLPSSLDLPDAGMAAAPIAMNAMSAADMTTAMMPGRVSSSYGWRKDPIDGQTKFHKGVDLAMPVGHDVPAARKGEVAFAGEMNGYGLTVVVQHGDQTATRYAHLSQILVNPGDTVAAGQTIALSGSSGRSTGPHLHFEVIEAGQAVDPSGAW